MLFVVVAVVVVVVGQAVMGDVLWWVDRLKWIGAQALFRICRWMSSTGCRGSDAIVNWYMPSSSRSSSSAYEC